MSKRRKNFYALYHKEEGTIFGNWAECKSFMDANPGPKQMKGFFYKDDAKKWLVQSGDDEPIEFNGHEPSDLKMELIQITTRLNEIIKTL